MLPEGRRPSSGRARRPCQAGGCTTTAARPVAASIRFEPTIWMFSPSFAATSTRSGSSAPAASSPPAYTASSTLPTNVWKSSFFETGSVSQPTAAIAPTLPSIRTSTLPSLVSRSARLAACAMPFSRRSFTAASKSPAVSWRARLQSIIPALVASRSSFTMLAEISVTRSPLPPGPTARRRDRAPARPRLSTGRRFGRCCLSRRCLARCCLGLGRSCRLRRGGRAWLPRQSPPEPPRCGRSAAPSARPG